MKNLLDRQEFAQWLHNSPQMAVVGLPREREACPIGQFLYFKTGEYWRVSALMCLPRRATTESIIRMVKAQTIADIHPEEFRPPSWARQFILAIDSTKRNSITARYASQILREVV